MARPIDHVPPPVREPTRASAEQELKALLETLHTSGTLRVLRGMLGSASRISDVVLDQMGTESGKNILGSLSIALTTLAETDPEGLSTFTQALRKSVRAARASMLHVPPSIVGLAALMMREDTRRGLHALLTLLSTLGQELAAPNGQARALTPVQARS